MLTCCHSKVLLSLSSSSQTLRVAVLSKTSDECRPAPMQEKGCVDTAVVCYVPHQLFSPSPLLAPPPLTRERWLRRGEKRQSHGGTCPPQIQSP